MPYSKEPESFAKLFWEILDYALESRERIEVATSEPTKIIARFYGFRNAWKCRSEEAEQMGNMELAAAHKTKSSALLRYMPTRAAGKVVFIHKDILSSLMGETLTASEQRVDDPLLESASNFAKAQHGVLFNEAPVVPVNPQATINKIFGTAEERRAEHGRMESVEEFTEEEKETLRKSGMEI